MQIAGERTCKHSFHASLCVPVSCCMQNGRVCIDATEEREEETERGCLLFLCVSKWTHCLHVSFLYLHLNYVSLLHIGKIISCQIDQFMSMSYLCIIEATCFQRIHICIRYKNVM